MTTSPLIAFCGLDCAACPGYQATQANDMAALERAVEQWRKEFNAPNMTVKDAICDGCTVNQRLGGHCGGCKIRACSLERNLASCADCPDYACAELQGFFSMAPAAKQTLDGLRAGR